MNMSQIFVYTSLQVIRISTPKGVLADHHLGWSKNRGWVAESGSHVARMFAHPMRLYEWGIPTQRSFPHIGVVPMRRARPYASASFSLRSWQIACPISCETA